MSFVGKTATVKVGSTSKTASCDIDVSYSGSEVLANGNSVSCSVPWPKNKALNKAVTMFVVVGDVNGDLINVKVQFTLFKKKNKASSTVKTNSPKFTGTEYQTDEPASYPADLWCPAEDKIIFTEAGDSDVANTVFSLSEIKVPLLTNPLSPWPRPLSLTGRSVPRPAPTMLPASPGPSTRRPARCWVSSQGSVASSSTTPSRDWQPRGSSLGTTSAGRPTVPLSSPELSSHNIFSYWVAGGGW